MTSLDIYVNSADLHTALSAVAHWHDPKTELEAWDRYRLVITESSVLALATNGIGAACASLPVHGISDEGHDGAWPVIVDIAPSQSGDLRHLFKPRKRAGDDGEPAGEDLRVQITDAVDDETGEAVREVTVTEAGGLWEGKTYTTQLPAVDAAFPRVVAALEQHLAAPPADLDRSVLEVHLAGSTTLLLARTAATVKDRLILERTKVDGVHGGGAFVARIGARCLVLLGEATGDDDQRRAASQDRAHWLDLLEDISGTEPTIAKPAPEAEDREGAALLSALDRLRAKGITVEASMTTTTREN